MKQIFILIFLGIILGCSNGSDNYSSPVNKGDFAFARREYQKAVNIWKKAYLKNQKDISLIEKLGDGYLKLGRPESAKSFFKKGSEIDPDNIKIQVKLAQVYFLTGDLPKADKICKILVEKNILHPELDLIQADISLVANQLDKAESFYRKAVISSKDSLRALMKLAIFLKSVNRDKEAVDVLKIVKKNTIKTAQISLLVADYYLLDNNDKKAEQLILDAIRLEPRDNSLKYHLIQFYIAIEENSKAQLMIEKILVDQDDIYLRMMLADIYILNQKLEKAEKIILELKNELKQPIIEFELLQGKFWLYSGRSVYATSHLKSAIDLKPGLVNTRYFLGLAHLINGKNKLSENSLTRTLQIQPNHYKALLLVSELLYKKKEYNLSLKYVDRLLENHPEDFTGHIIKGLNLLGLKQYTSAKIEFNKSLRLDGRPGISDYYLGLTEEFIGDGTSALKHYKQTLEIYPDLIDVGYRYSMLLVKMKKNKTAESFIKKRLTAKKDSPEVFYLAAKVALTMGHLKKGESFLKKAIQFDNASGYMYMEFAEFYKNCQQIKKSIEILKQCTIKKPNFQDAWLALCKIYIDDQDFITALEIMEEGYKKFPDSPVFQSNLAWLLLEENQEINKALSLSQSAYEKMPNSVSIADTLGWAYYHKGIYSQAVWLLSEIVKKEPENGFVNYHLGMVYYQQGEIDKAIAHLEIARNSSVSIHFSDKIDRVFTKISKAKHEKSESETSLDEESILSVPDNEDFDDDIIQPQWKQ